MSEIKLFRVISVMPWLIYNQGISHNHAPIAVTWLVAGRSWSWQDTLPGYEAFLDMEYWPGQSEKKLPCEYAIDELFTEDEAGLFKHWLSQILGGDEKHTIVSEIRYPVSYRAIPLKPPTEDLYRATYKIAELDCYNLPFKVEGCFLRQIADS